MRYQEFSEFLDSHRKGEQMISELYDIGLDLMEGKYRISEVLYEHMSIFFSSHYDPEGLEWIFWFMYENEYGEKDWSGIKNMEGETLEKHGAFDEEGNPIFYSYESSWEYLEKYHKIKES